MYIKKKSNIIVIMSITSYETKSFFFKMLDYIVPNVCICDNFDDYMNVTTKGSVNIDYVNQHFVSSFVVKELNSDSKFRLLKDMLNNPFMTNEKKDELFMYFGLAQKTYLSFKNLMNVIKHKKSKKYEFDCDLCLGPLSEINSKFVISLLEGNTTYRFRIHDLVRLIENALIYAPDLFSDPQDAKNPHTNLDFSKSNLYNIYFHLLENNIKIPTLFHLYYTCGFNLTKILDDYEPILRDKSIEKNYKEMDEDDKYDEIIDMIDRYKKTLKSISIDIRFSHTKVVERFHHTILNFMYTKYSYNPNLKLKKRHILLRQLSKINEETPLFGRSFVRAIMPSISANAPYMPYTSVSTSTINNNPFNSLITRNSSQLPLITPSISDPLLSNNSQQNLVESSSLVRIQNTNDENIRNFINRRSFESFDRELEDILTNLRSEYRAISEEIGNTEINEISSADSDDEINNINEETETETETDFDNTSFMLETTNSLSIMGVGIGNNSIRERSPTPGPYLEPLPESSEEEETLDTIDVEDMEIEDEIPPPIPSSIPEEELNLTFENLQNQPFDLLCDIPNYNDDDDIPTPNSIRNR